MSDQGSFPPPGEVPPGASWQPPPSGQEPPPESRPGPGAPGPGMLGAAHRPGAVPLRPLGLGDMFEGAFRIIRFNPKATVGAALLVAVVAMALPLVVTAALTASVGAAVDPATGEPTGVESAGFLGSVVSQGVGTLLLQVGLLLVTGLIAHVTHEAAAGRRIGLGQAWQMTRGRRWRLVGLVLLVALLYTVVWGLWIGSIAVLLAAGTATGLTILWGVLSGVVVLVVSVVVYVRVVLLATPTVMLEDVGVLEALGRAGRLTRNQFWRVLGIALVTAIVVGIAGAVVSLPVTLGAQLLALNAPEYALLLMVTGQALAAVVSTAFTSPFTAVVTTLQYLDQRIRKEAYDVTLMSRAGITGA